jgi:SAM-dependent methyltransferase
MAVTPGPRVCPVCGAEAITFLEHRGREEALCPSCGVLERHRFLGYLIGRLAPMIASASAVLDVAPQPGITRQLRDLVGARYVGVDLATVRPVDVRCRLEGLPFADGCFDFLVCYHVLEHVTDDTASMQELARVLSPRGLAVLQVPLGHGVPTDEDPTAPVEERARRFGQADHLRLYGDDFPDRLADAGLEAVRTRPQSYLSAELEDLYRVGGTAVWLCRRSDRWTERRPRRLSERSVVQRF